LPWAAAAASVVVMGYARTRAVGLVGLAGHLVTVEAHVAPGLPALVLSGLPDAALNEARDRVRAAVVNSGEAWPQRRITVNLLPADLPKRGSGFDLAIAVVLLAAAGQVPAGAVEGATFIGELGLDGRVRPVRGVLAMVLAATRAGVERVVVPEANAGEAALVPGTSVRAVDTLRQIIDVARGKARLEPSTMDSVAGRTSDRNDDVASEPDLAEVVGQERGRFALELAAAGGHHLALFGPPGAGKTMLAQRLPSILPPLDDAAALEVTAIYSIAGLLPPDPRLIRRPPFQAPHHTASIAALVGGGSGLARPGAVSLSHHGVLFLDEAPLFGATVLDGLRQPLEERWITLARTQGVTRYPAAVQLVLAANPCPCGARTDPAGAALSSECDCTPIARRRYLGRLSGPLLDRVDLRVTLQPVGAVALLDDLAKAEPSEAVRKRVTAARAAAADRWAALGYRTNADVPGSVLRRVPYRLPSAATATLTRYLDSGALSARGFDRVLRVAWSIVDLAGGSRPSGDDVAEALELRRGGPA
jgi:magnesium chelatase family protein